MNLKHSRNRFLTSLFVAAVAADVSACASSPSSEDAFGVGAGPTYVIQSTVFTVDGSTSYIGTVSTLDGSEEFDATNALELGGTARTFGPEKAGWIAIGDNEAVTVTRYELDGEDGFRKGKAMGLQNRGITNLSADVTFISDTKAYYVDWENASFLIWNPTTMEIEGEIDLTSTIARDGWTAMFGDEAIRRGTQLLYPVTWRNTDNEPNVDTSDTGLITIDTTTNELVDYQVDERCSAGVQISSPNGDTYLVSPAEVAVGWARGGIETPPCVLRVRGNEASFDEDYFVDLSELTGGLAGDAILASEGALYIRQLDEGVSNPADATSVWDVAFAEAWLWYRWDFDTNQLTPVDGLGYSAGGGGGLYIDGKTYLTQSTADYSRTTLVDMSDPAGPKLGLTANGYTYTVLRAR